MVRHGVIGAVVLASLAFGEAASAQHWTRLTDRPGNGFSPYFLKGNMTCRWLAASILMAALLAGVCRPTRAQQDSLGNGSAHWQRVLSPTEYGDTHMSPYFFNSQVGFTFMSGVVEVGGLPQVGAAHPRLARTTDGGATWTQINFFDSIGCGISQLCFVSLMHGYASTVYGPSGIYETMDQGMHWKKITLGNNWFESVYASKGSIFAIGITLGFFGPGLGTQLIYSRNDGLSWDSVPRPGRAIYDSLPDWGGFQWVYGNLDSLVAAVYLYPYVSLPNGNSYLVYSSNLGNTWQSVVLDSSYPWCTEALHIPPHSCRIIRQIVDSTVDDTYTFLQADTPYTSRSTLLPHLETGAWIAGNDCAMYLSVAGLNGTGQQGRLGPLLRSTDRGSTWISVGTYQLIYGQEMGFVEIDDDDWQNLSAVGYGAVLYASGNNGIFWKTTDGGDGTLSQAALAPRIEFDHDTFPTGNDTLIVAQCSQSSMTVYYQNLSCAITKLDSISISGLGPNEYSLTSTNHNDCLSLPDTTYVTLTPIAPGTYPIIVNAHFIDDEYNTIDTTLNVVLMVKASGTTIPLNLHFKSSAISAHAGDTISIPVYLSGNATLGATSITLPFGIDTNVLRVIGFRPAIAGMTAGAVVWAGGTGTVPLLDSGLTLNGDTIIGYLRWVVYLADSLATSVTLQNASLNSSTAPCTALSLTTDSVNILIIGCGDQTLLQFMKSGKISFGIQSITPNPAGGVAQISFINPTGAPISYAVLDALGQTREHGAVLGSALSLDVSRLVPGVYFIRATGGEGVSVSRQLVILR